MNLANTIYRVGRFEKIQIWGDASTDLTAQVNDKSIIKGNVSPYH